MGNPALSLVPRMHYRRLLRVNRGAQGLSYELHVRSHIKLAAFTPNDGTHAKLRNGRAGEKGRSGKHGNHFLRKHGALVVLVVHSRHLSFSKLLGHPFFGHIFFPVLRRVLLACLKGFFSLPYHSIMEKNEVHEKKDYRVLF